MSFVERFILLCPYLGESTIRGSTVYTYVCTFVVQMNNKCLIIKGIILLHTRKGRNFRGWFIFAFFASHSKPANINPRHKVQR